MKTYSSLSNAKRAAKTQKLDTGTLDFVKDADGRVGFVAKIVPRPETIPVVNLVVVDEPTSIPTVKKAAKKAAKAKAAGPKPMPKATINGQGSLNKRSAKDGTKHSTKSDQVRGLILAKFNIAEPNPEECIKLIQAEQGFGRNLARIYFANNLQKVFPSTVTAEPDAE